MNNASLKAFLTEYGEKTFCITVDNGHKIFINAPTSDGNIVHAQNIEMKTFGDTDMFGIHRVDRTWGFNGTPYMTWFVTACIQSISATDELSVDLPDLNKWK